jgi:hypothetical protein
MSLDRERLPGFPHYPTRFGANSVAMSAPAAGAGGQTHGERAGGHAGARDAIVPEDSADVFDLAGSKYSISGERNKCRLHLWSAERNLVRRVLEVEIKREVAAGPTRPTFPAISRAPGGRPPVGPRDRRCDRLAAKLRAGRFDRLPRGCARIDLSSDQPPDSAWSSVPGEIS